MIGLKTRRRGKAPPQCNFFRLKETCYKQPHQNEPETIEKRHESRAMGEQRWEKQNGGPLPFKLISLAAARALKSFHPRVLHSALGLQMALNYR